MILMRIFKSKSFARFAYQNGIEDSHLCQALVRLERGLIDADLGGGVIKQRIGRKGQGRSGGFRTIILFRVEERAFFVYGFAKSQKANIAEHQLKAFKVVAKTVLNNTDNEIRTLLQLGEFLEVKCDEENI